MTIQTETKSMDISKKVFTIIWIIFSISTTLIGIKLRNMMLTLALVAGVPIIFMLIKVPKRLIYAEIVYGLVVKYFISVFNVPSVANYVTDIINILAFIIAIGTYIKRKQQLNIKLTTKIVIAMIIFSIIGLIINGQSILLYIWGFRNIYRFFGFIFSCIVLLQKEDIKKIFSILNVFLIINFILCIYQYFILHVGGDHIGGIFGTATGVNGYMNIYLVIMFSYALADYLYKNKSFTYLIVVSIIVLFIAAISELKMFFVEFIIIAFLGVLLSNFNRRTFLLVAVSALGLYVSVNVLYVIYPSFKDFFNADTIISYSSERGYSTEDELNRLTAIKTIDKMFLDNTSKKILGIGLGSAETSQIKTFNSSFFDKYGLQLKYTWFSHAFMLWIFWIDIIYCIFPSCIL